MEMLHLHSKWSVAVSIKVLGEIKTQCGPRQRSNSNQRKKKWPTQEEKIKVPAEHIINQPTAHTCRRHAERPKERKTEGRETITKRKSLTNSLSLMVWKKSDLSTWRKPYLVKGKKKRTSTRPQKGPGIMGRSVVVVVACRKAMSLVMTWPAPPQPPARQCESQHFEGGTGTRLKCGKGQPIMQKTNWGCEMHLNPCWPQVF